MFARLAALLSILAVALLTTVTTVHAATISTEPDHVAHTSQMMQLAASDVSSCDDPQHCEAPDAGTCEVLCGVAPAFLTSLNGNPAPDRQPAVHDRPSAAMLAGLAPGLHERPPRFPLL